MATYTIYDGSIGYGYYVSPSKGFAMCNPIENVGVRPALHVSPSSIKSYAGTVCSAEGEGLLEFQDVKEGVAHYIYFKDQFEKINDIIVCGEDVIDYKISNENQAIVLEGIKKGFATVIVYNKKGKVIKYIAVKVS